MVMKYPELNFVQEPKKKKEILGNHSAQNQKGKKREKTKDTGGGPKLLLLGFKFSALNTWVQPSRAPLSFPSPVGLGRQLTNQVAALLHCELQRPTVPSSTCSALLRLSASRFITHQSTALLPSLGSCLRTRLVQTVKQQALTDPKHQKRRAGRSSSR